MVFEHKLAMVRLLLKLDATEALRIMTRERGCAPELVYDSLQTPGPGSLQEITFAFHYVPWFFSSSLCLSLFHFSAPSWQDIDFRML